MSPVLHLRTPSPAELSDVLRAPSPNAAPLSERLTLALRARLALALTGTHGRRRLDAFCVERDGSSFTSPFAWSARVARRTIGTAAARAVASSVQPDAQAAAVAEVDRLCDRAVRGLTRHGSLGAWLCGEPAIVRDLCAVEAATWASGLLDLVGDDAAARSLTVGVPDAWFEVPGLSLTMCGRRDVATATTPDAHRVSFLRVRDGMPGARAVDGLVVDGLIDALAAPERPVPARVVGAWPDAGLCLVVEFDEEAVRRAARAVVACAARLVVPPQQRALHPVAA